MRYFAISIIIITLIGCGFKDHEEYSPPSSIKTINPEIKTEYGTIGNCKTQDEYYLDKSGNKVWHGHRKNFYPTGKLRFDAYYEHGKNIWNKKYNETGNEIN